MYASGKPSVITCPLHALKTTLKYLYVEDCECFLSQKQNQWRKAKTVLTFMQHGILNMKGQLAWRGGGGAPLIVQHAADADKNTVASAARLPRCIQGSFECDGFPGKREEKMNGADFHHHLQLFAAAQMCCAILCSVFSHISFRNQNSTFTQSAIIRTQTRDRRHTHSLTQLLQLLL